MTMKIMPTYFNQMPVKFEYGRGAWLFDENNTAYLDSLAGIAVCGLGHAHPDITQVIIDQASKVLHTSNNFQIPKQIELAEKLCHIADMDQVYFCNSGAEANEAAIKLSRLYARKKNITHPLVITMKHSFHGRTMATLSASGTERIQIGFEPLVKEFVYVDLNDITQLKKIVEAESSRIVAIMLEPIQGDGGIKSATSEYLHYIRQLCDSHDWLMILDEVQTGMGRTGKWFAHQHDGIQPDVMTVAKALGNGIPIAACLAKGKACNLFGPGKHGTTFGGNPFVCAVGSKVIDVIETNHLLSHVEQMGKYLLSKIKSDLCSQYKNIIDVRGKGLMLGIELDKPCLDFVGIALKHHLVCNVTSNTVIRLLPPLIINTSEADELIIRLDRTLAEFTTR